MRTWASTPFIRNQHLMFSPTLDEAIAEDHPVRAFDAILASINWDDWEYCYPKGPGRPPIHPRRMAALILYGMTKRIRSSRMLEAACHDHMDVLWLMEGHQPDHSTICDFRTKHKEQLVELFKMICLLGGEIGLVRLNSLAIDGTAIRANSSRNATFTLDGVKIELEGLKQWMDEQLTLADVDDAKEDEEHGDNANRLSEELADAQKRREKLEAAQKVLEELEAAKKKKGLKNRSKAQLPKTDTDSRIMPNKDGGFAPNYTAIVTADSECGFIMDVIVITGNAEAEATAAAMDRITEVHDKAPAELLADGLFSQGPLIEEMAERNIDFYSPLTPTEPQDGNPAKRDDPTQAVPEDQIGEIPKQGGKFTKAAFVYDAENDLYYCPAGNKLTPKGSTEQRTTSTGLAIETRRYCADPDDCQGCPMKSYCTDAKSRTVKRDEYADLRDAHASKMQTDEAKEKYRHRMGIGEAPFGFLKGQWGIRQFLLRGLEKVNIEMMWIVTASNLKKMMSRPETLRALAAKKAS